MHPDLLGLENVLLSPHLGSATRETRTAMADLAVDNVLAVLERPAAADADQVAMAKSHVAIRASSTVLRGRRLARRPSSR